MNKLIAVFTFIFLGLISCAQDKTQEKNSAKEITTNTEKVSSIVQWIDPNGMTIEDRFNVPSGFIRKGCDSGSYCAYLRNLPLKKNGALVKHYDGSTKANRNVYDAVIDLPIGKRDLHQCADAVMRLRAEYLYAQGDFDRIHFNFTNGFRVDYSEWIKGKRIKVSGNKVSWVQSHSSSNTYKDFWNYMEIIFSYAGTLSLDKELKSVPIMDMKIGDVFIKGGSPGHAIVVVDMAVHEVSGKKKFLLAQSYMPAQDIQLLKNPASNDDSPWYDLEEDMYLQTPEWSFTSDQLKRFE